MKNSGCVQLELRPFIRAISREHRGCWNVTIRSRVQGSRTLG